MVGTVNETTYVAEVERDHSGTWIASVPALRGVHTYARTLTSLRVHLQDAIALWLEVELQDAGEPNPRVDRQAVHVDLRVNLPAAARRAADAAVRCREQARSAEAEAAAASRAAARALVDSGLSRRDAAEVLGLSHQRVQQLLRT
jgi:predicted RNase H-like HicB family nuclease